MRREKVDERAKYRLVHHQRALQSETLATKYPDLKSIVVELTFSSPERLGRLSHIKQTIALEHTSSILRFDCPNHECVRGDFDLTDELQVAIRQKDKLLTGQKTCEGWLNKMTIDRVRCQKLFQYQIRLVFK